MAKTTTSNDVQLKHVIKAAAQFLQAARLLEHREGDDRPPRWGAPCSANYALAAELALKALLLRELGSFPHTHDLWDLWNFVPPDWRAKIIAKVETSGMYRWEFTRDLESAREDFPKWRYYFDTLGVDPDSYIVGHEGVLRRCAFSTLYVMGYAMPDALEELKPLAQAPRP
jgi:hypothetical protein